MYLWLNSVIPCLTMFSSFHHPSLFSPYETEKYRHQTSVISSYIQSAFIRHLDCGKSQFQNESHLINVKNVMKSWIKKMLHKKCSSLHFSLLVKSLSILSWTAWEEYSFLHTESLRCGCSSPQPLLLDQQPLSPRPIDTYPDYSRNQPPSTSARKVMLCRPKNIQKREKKMSKQKMICCNSELACALAGLSPWVGFSLVGQRKPTATLTRPLPFIVDKK